MASLFFGVPVAAAGPTVGLATHRAVYDLTLKHASERSGVEGMYGRMVYEFRGSRCAGYTVSFRFVTAIDVGDENRLTDQQTTTFEDAREGTFHFATKSFVNNKLDHETRGRAKENGDRLAVELEAPSERSLDLAESKFPTEHMIELIENARKGTHFYQSRIFDGSDEGDKSLVTSAVLGGLESADPADPEAARAKNLAGEPFWPVSIAYFEDDGGGDEIPTYQIAFKLYENGVTRDLTMDYGEFTLGGTLADIEFFEEPDCTPSGN